MNSLFTIAPYKTRHGVWVFDDPARELKAEPLIAGIDDMLDRVANGENSLVVVFAEHPFPGWQIRLCLVKEKHIQSVSAFRSAELEGEFRLLPGSVAVDPGNTYYSPELKMEGWLCPALYKYFPKAPQTIYAQFRANPDKQ